MKRSSNSIYFTSITLLTLMLLTSACSQPREREAVSGAEADEVIRQEPIDVKTVMLPGDVPLEMVWIPPGSFMMGSPDQEQGRLDSESPQHEVTIAEGFWMGKYEITQVQWEAVMENNPSHFKGNDRPVENVSWNDIRGTNGYLKKLNEAHPGHNFRLPSEAEWEYAYRAGTTTRFYWGDDLDYTEIDKYAWYQDNSSYSTHDVGLKVPNAWGLYDMAGNVYEWCEDIWHYNYVGAPEDGSARVNSPRGSTRLLRGGSWGDDAHISRAAHRSTTNTDSIDFILGFRVVCNMD